MGRRSGARRHGPGRQRRRGPRPAASPAPRGPWPRGRLGAVADGVDVRVVGAGEVVGDDDAAVDGEAGPAERASSRPVPQHMTKRSAAASTPSAKRMLSSRPRRVLTPTTEAPTWVVMPSRSRLEIATCDASQPSWRSMSRSARWTTRTLRPRFARPVATSTPSTPAPRTTAPPGAACGVHDAGRVGHVLEDEHALDEALVVRDTLDRGTRAAEPVARTRSSYRCSRPGRRRRPGGPGRPPWPRRR